MKVGLRERDALNSLRSPEDFLKLFNLEKPKEASDADGIFARFGGGECPCKRDKKLQMKFLELSYVVE